MMKTASVSVILAASLCLAHVSVVIADGLIHQLPKDGSWVRFDATGEGLSPGGEVTLTLKGTVTVKSVGMEVVDGTICRWIEIETGMEASGARGPRGPQTEVFKLLIPEKHLVPGQNPRDHALKAWKKDTKGADRELDLKGDDARAVASLDELLNAGLAKSEKRDGVEIKVPGGTFRCTHLNGRESPEAGNVDLEIQTWLTDEVPFGVVAYRHTKMRKNEGQSLGGRWMELKFAAAGADAKSAIGRPVTE
ncbi:MAG TPA: hypothetical protein VGZ22_05040 [Isosphaeraceae bacterium]|jgi:hypothetical protein|nr:hypothetical protein [Isosphaeraceae bacterium]